MKNKQKHIHNWERTKKGYKCKVKDCKKELNPQREFVN